MTPRNNIGYETAGVGQFIYLLTGDKENAWGEVGKWRIGN